MKMEKMVSDVRKGDQVTRADWGDDSLFEFDGKCYRDLENGVSLMSLNHEDMSADDWQIIPAKKEMVSADEYFKRAGKEPGKWCADDIYTAWQASEQNRDLLYADLLEAVRDFLKDMNTDSTESTMLSLHRVKLNAILQKINDVLNPDTYIQGT